MTKSNFFKKPFFGYFRELSVVIIGVTVTFGGSALFSSINGNKQLSYYYGSIKTEMEYNLQQLENAVIYHEKAFDSAYYLRHTPTDSLSQDSLIKKSSYYNNQKQLISVIYSTHEMKPRIGAFDSFKLSGMMPHSKEPDVLLKLVTCYADIDDFKDDNNSIMKLRVDAIFKVVSSISTLKPMPKSDIEIIKHPENFDFFMILSNESHYETLHQTASKLIEDYKSCIAAINNCRYVRRNK